MEVYHLVLCCMLFTTVASFSILNAIPGYTNNSVADVEHGRRCQCDNGRCVTDNRGNTKCVCRPGYALQDEYTCKPCCCGPLGKCIFILKLASESSQKSKEKYKYQKKCVCDVGSAEKDGKCIACYCGENSACDFDYGRKRCFCIDGYAEKYGACTKCDCGFNGKCEFDHGIKKCECDEGYLVLNGKCEECDCGEQGICSFVNGVKTCQCKSGYSVNNGHCDACDCGYNGKCLFDRGIKKCECNEKFLDLNGVCQKCDCGDHGSCSFVSTGRTLEYVRTCDCFAGYSENKVRGVCDACDCGENAVECRFDRGQKECVCKEGFASREGVCEDCDCGNFSHACSFDNNIKKCQCHAGYVQKDSKCKVGCSDSIPCQNGGYCKEGFCFCLPGTRGEFCEVIEECAHLCPQQDDINCTYDVGQQKAYCKCLDSNFRYNPDVKQCRYPCTDKRPCRNGGICSSTPSGHFCRCLEGTTGDFCEVVPECDTKNCGSDAACVYDLKQRKAICVCNKRDLSFDPTKLQCKYSCDETRKCRNGGRCTSKGSDSFCDCLEGTTGDLCEEVPECYRKNCGPDARCLYDPSQRKGVCSCNDANLSFDVATLQCKKTCDESNICENGGVCEPSEFAKFCRCPEGTVGDFCEEIPGCNDLDCGREAQCKYDVGERRATCMCNDGKLSFDSQDKRCKESCDEYQTLCVNGGQCVRSFCDCLNGTAGDLCDNVPECNTKNCGKDAVCVYSQERRSPICVCTDSKYSFDEESLTCRRGCNFDDECRSGARCISTGISKFCDCPPGTKGDSCEIVDDCETGRVKCKDNAYCVFDAEMQKAVCACPDGRRQYDSVTEKCTLTCGEDALCQNGGLCSNRDDYPFCHCRPGTSGDLCEIVDDCARCLCGYSEGVRCVYDVNRQAGVCQCRNPEHLYDPVSKMCKACDCGRNSESCSYENGNKVCTCRDDYQDRSGICRKTKCLEKTCLNGKCVVNNDDQEACSCDEGYETDGDYCRRLNCTNTPCGNGTCIVRRGNVEQCQCPDGHSLHAGVCIRGDCRANTCYGGNCRIIDEEVTCVCPKGYSLQGIGCFAELSPANRT